MRAGVVTECLLWCIGVHGVSIVYGYAIMCALYGKLQHRKPDNLFKYSSLNENTFAIKDNVICSNICMHFNIQIFARDQNLAGILPSPEVAETSLSVSGR